MFKTVHRFGLYALTAVLVPVVGSRVSLAQDPVKVAPNIYKVALENDSVRVCNVQVKAGEKVATHSHPDHLVYAINGGKVKFTYPDGKTKDVELKTGEANFIKAETHVTENIGTTDLKLVVFELKKPAVAGSKPKPLEGDDQVKAAPESTKVVLDNERVRLLGAHIKAGGKLAKHSHPAHVVYALADAKYKVTAGDGKTVEKSLTAGQASWNEPTTHTVENMGAAESQILVLELKE
jgi:quercetin dioxygenase-like cupin family protein